MAQQPTANVAARTRQSESATPLRTAVTVGPAAVGPKRRKLLTVSVSVVAPAAGAARRCPHLLVPAAAAAGHHGMAGSR